MLTNLNCYFNLSFVRPSVRLVIKKLKGGGIKTQKFFALLFCCFFSTEHMFFWFHSLIRHIQMLNHLNCYFNMSFVRPSVCLVINRLRLDSGKRTKTYNRRIKWYKLTEGVTPTTEPLTYITFLCYFHYDYNQKY